MLCCLLAAIALSPLGLLIPRAARQGGADCRARHRRAAGAVGLSVAAFAALGLGAWLLSRNQPAAFHHICRFFPGS